MGKQWILYGNWLWSLYITKSNDEIGKNKQLGIPNNKRSILILYFQIFLICTWNNIKTGNCSLTFLSIYFLRSVVDISNGANNEHHIQEEQTGNIVAHRTRDIPNIDVEAGKQKPSNCRHLK